MSILTNNKRFKQKEDLDKLDIVNTGYVTVLKYLNLIKDSRFTEQEKMGIALRMFYGKQHIKNIKEAIDNMTKFINIDVYDNRGNNDDSPKERYIDFEQDAELIYSAFLQTYNIDIIDNNLHWHKFIALLKGLDKNTKFMEIISIRSRKIPKATKYNREEIAELRRLKKLYAIEIDEKEQVDNINVKADFIFGALKQKAVTKNG